MPDKHKVVFVDDESIYARPYVEVLEETFEVTYNNNATDGLQSVHNQHDLRCLILDIMMPTPDNVSSADTEENHSTGIWLLGQILSRIKNKGRPLPVCVLTNRRPKDVVGKISKLGIEDELFVVRHKSDTQAFFLPRIVRQLIDRHYPRD